jgi:DNA repair photolyase
LARNTSPDIPFDRSINPYRGCEHGCSYCFARPSHAQLGYSPGLDFETKLVAKPEAALQLRAELAKKNYRPAPIALGTNTDPYQPIEKGLRITREILETLIDCKHPFTIVTKSALVARDIDILAAAAKENLVSVHLSVTTIDRKLSRMMEPRASRPSKRLETIRALSRAGIPVGVMAAPMIPGLTDMELESILEAAATAGAVSAGYLLLRLPLEIKALFTEWLEENVPDRASRVLKLMREAYGGKLYDSEFGLRGVGSGPFAELLGERFRLSAARLGLKGKTHQLDSSKFEAPTAPKKPSPQLDLF